MLLDVVTNWSKKQGRGAAWGNCLYYSTSPMVLERALEGGLAAFQVSPLRGATGRGAAAVSPGGAVGGTGQTEGLTGPEALRTTVPHRRPQCAPESPF